MNAKSVVIVGSSLAGIKSARELRSCGHEGTITMIGAEPGLPYDRPPLSKQYLLGSVDSEELLLASADEIDELGIELISDTSVTAVDLHRRAVHCEGIGEVGYTHLIAATGAHARRPAWARDLQGVHYVRTREDSQQLKEALETAQHLTIVGGGFIGTEVAATARSRGIDVTLIVDTRHALENLGVPIGARFTELFSDRGVEVLTNTAVVDACGTTRVESLLLADGRRIDADTVVVAVGAVPNTAWLGRAVDKLGGAIAVDQESRVGDGFWAAGDVTGSGHWYAAVRQARLAARSILGIEDRTTTRLLDEIPYAWTDQFELKVQALGVVGSGQDWQLLPGHEVNQIETSGVTGLYSRGGVVTGAVMVNRPQDMAKIRRHIATCSPVDTVLDDLGAMVRP